MWVIWNTIFIWGRRSCQNEHEHFDLQLDLALVEWGEDLSRLTRPRGLDGGLDGGLEGGLKHRRKSH